MVDANLRLVAWNQRYEELFDYPHDMVAVGRPIEDLIRYNAQRGWLVTDDVERSVARRLQFMRAGHAAHRTSASCPNGTVLEIRGNPMPGGGFVTSYSDVTALQARAARAAGRQRHRSRSASTNARAS